MAISINSTTACALPGVGACSRLVFDTDADGELVAAQGVGKTIEVLGVVIGGTSGITGCAIDDDTAKSILGPFSLSNLLNITLLPLEGLVYGVTADNDALNVNIVGTGNVYGTVWYRVVG